MEGTEITLGNDLFGKGLAVRLNSCAHKAKPIAMYYNLRLLIMFTSMSECLSIFRPELCRALDTKVRTQSAFINRRHVSGTWHIESFNCCQSYKVCWPLTSDQPIILYDFSAACGFDIRLSDLLFWPQRTAVFNRKRLKNNLLSTKRTQLATGWWTQWSI